MRVGLDARALVSSTRSGVELYVSNLVRALGQLEEAPPITAYTDRPITDPDLARAASSGSLHPAVVSARWGWLRMGLPLRLRRDQVDVAHFPSTILPPFLPCPAVVTVHDLAWRKFPDSYAPDDLKMQEVALRSACRAARVIAVSYTTAHDLEAAGCPRDKITVTPLGVSPEFSPEAPPLAPDAFPGAERLQGGYLLYLGRLQARKNLRRLIEAYRQVREAQDAPPLVLAGAESEYGDELARRVEEMGLGEYVLFPGQVPDTARPSLCRSATLFVYVSLYEGFGLPVLEAMASGVPVITSNVGGTAEVAGDAAVTVDPGNVTDVVNAIRLLLEGEGTRTDYRARGLERARHFTWEHTAQETVAVYQRAAKT